MRKEALFYTLCADNAAECNLCPHNCFISDGKSGFCLIRKNIGGKLYQTSYGEVSSIALDPIEKKPLFHFYPESKILSIGTNGCNLRCDFCQNWSISTTETLRSEISPIELVNKAIEKGALGIAYTYNEPLIWYEFVKDCAEVFRENGLKNVLVTNGYINEQPLKELLPFIDAVNIDLKAFTNEFYTKAAGSLDVVKRNIKTIFEAGICTEVTNLIIPTRNDDQNIFTDMCRWLASVSDNIPLHLSAYFPAYHATEPPTSPNYLNLLKKIAEEHLKYVYTGNIRGENNDSKCPHCKSVLVKRNGYAVKSFLISNRCNQCGMQLYFFV